MSAQWHYVQNGKSLGPVPEEQLRSLVSTGALKPADLAWREGMGGWTAIQDLPELRAPAAAPAVNPYTPPEAAILAAGPVSAGPVPAEVVELLRRTKPWVRLFGVLGILGIALMVLGALAMAALSFGPFLDMPLPARLGMAGLYGVLAIVYIPPVLYLHRYASRIRDLVETNTAQNLEAALRAQKSFWKYLGVFTVVILCAYALALLVLLVAGLALGLGHRS